MGIPRFYAEIIKRYNNIQKLLLEKSIDYLFIDFNGIIYDAYNICKLDYNEIKNNAKFENLLINEILKLTKDIIINIIKPNKCVYISIDGPAPRAKMVQQRSRRYKGTIYEPKINNLIRKEFEKEEIYNDIWNPSINASPGTKFMMKLSNSLKNKICKNYFGKELKVILSDAFCPGEGEHKFLNYIRELPNNSNESYCLYGKDADLLVLSMTLKKNNIYICRPNDDKKTNNEHKYVFLNIDNMKENFYKEIINGLPKPYPENINLENIIRDTTFINSFVGNDFVKAPFYLKVNQDSLDLIMNIYKNILYDMKTLLITGNNNNLLINHQFLLKIFAELSIHEDQLMKNYYFKKIKPALNGKINHENRQKEYSDEFEYIINTYQHMPICDPKNPLFKIYGNEFKKIDYSKPSHIWKKQYYQYYFNINVNNNNNYNNYRTKFCINYLESLLFTLKYYYNEPPSWTWFYEYRVCPCFSDIYTTLNKYLKNINDIKFNKGQPYTPFQQLMLILSPQSKYILPKNISNLMSIEPFVQYYPIMIEIDATAGFKYIYSEALLPEINENDILPEIIKLEKKLGKNDNIRNTIHYEPFVHN